MGLSYVHPDAPGAGPHYLFVESFGPQRNTGTIAGRVLVYASPAARAAWKAADAALLDLHNQVQAKEQARQSAQNAFAALSDEDKAAQQEAFQASQASLTAEIEALKQQQATQTQTLQANRPKLAEDFTIPPGGVPIADTGAVLLTDVYPWLATNTYPGATVE